MAIVVNHIMVPRNLQKKKYLQHPFFSRCGCQFSVFCYYFFRGVLSARVSANYQQAVGYKTHYSFS
jgi:hypothetical protein